MLAHIGQHPRTFFRESASDSDRGEASEGDSRGCQGEARGGGGKGDREGEGGEGCSAGQRRGSARCCGGEGECNLGHGGTKASGSRHRANLGPQGGALLWLCTLNLSFASSDPLETQRRLCVQEFGQQGA